MRTNILEGRATSGFPLSVATGLALESLFEPTQEVIDPDRNVKDLKVKDIKIYTLFIINVDTLIRNIINSVDSQNYDLLTKEMVYPVLIEEMGFINWISNQKGLRVEFYINTYKHLKETYKDEMRQASTPKQLKEESIHKYSIDEIRKYDKDKDVKVFDTTIRYSKTDKVLMLSHIPADLLSHDKFVSLSLLESHTGVIKTLKEFNSKYYPIPRMDMSFLPFYEYLLVTFGDKTMFKPKAIKKRMEVYNSLKDKRVNPTTSEYTLGLMGLLG